MVNSLLFCKRIFQTKFSTNNSREVVGAIRQLLLASEYLEKTDDSFLSSKQFNRVDEVKKAINFLKRLNNEVSEKKDINKSCSSLVEITNGIIEDANTLDDEKIPSKIKENLFSLINSARATTRKTTLALKQWDCAKDEYIQSLVEYLKVFGNESNNLDKVPPLCPDDNSPPSSASSQAISTRDTNERRLASKMVDILKSKYSSFRTEWDQQAATKREEVLNLLEGELNKERHRSNELTKVLSAKSNSDLRTLRRLERSGPQDNFEAIDPSNISSQLIDCASSCGEITIDVLLCVHDSVGDLDNLRNRNDLSNQDTQFNQNISSLVQSLKRAIDLLKVWVSVDKPSISASSFNINKTIDTEGEYKVINSLLDTLSQTLSTTIIKPKLIQSVIKTVSESQGNKKIDLLFFFKLKLEILATEMGNYFSMKIKIEQTLQSLVHRECSSLRSLSLQLMTALNALAAQQSKIDLQTVFQVKLICNLLFLIILSFHIKIIRHFLSLKQF